MDLVLCVVILRKDIFCDSIESWLNSDCLMIVRLPYFVSKFSQSRIIFEKILFLACSYSLGSITSDTCMVCASSRKDPSTGLVSGQVWLKTSFLNYIETR